MSYATLIMNPFQSVKVRMSDGCNLVVKLCGDSSNPLFIVHHSAPGAASHEESEQYYGFLSARFNLLVFDARGSGDSEMLPPYTHERWVSDIDELRYFVYHCENKSSL